MRSLLSLLLLGSLSRDPAFAQGKEFRETIRKEIQLPGKSGTLAVYNINGSVSVQGYNGDKVVFEITKRITAENAARLEIGKKESSLNFESHGDTLLVYNNEPHDSRPHQHRRQRLPATDEGYDYAFDFIIRMPFGANLVASTVNGGKVEVQGVRGAVKARNVNGSIALRGLRGNTTAHTVNGPVKAEFDAVPPGDLSFRTINGSIDVAIPPGLNADVYLKTMHGDLLTDFTTTNLPTQITQNAAPDGRGTRYRINHETAVRIGTGGRAIHCETLNGSITLKKRNS